MISCDLCEMSFISFDQGCEHLKKLVKNKVDIYNKRNRKAEEKLNLLIEDNQKKNGQYIKDLEVISEANRILEFRIDRFRLIVLYFLAGIDLDEDLTKYATQARIELLELERSGYIPQNLRIKE